MDRHEFLGERVIRRNQRVARPVAHFAGDEMVDLAFGFGGAKAVAPQAAADRAGPDAEPVGDLVRRPAEQPDEPELADGAVACCAKARRGGCGVMKFCHTGSITPPDTLPDSKGRIARVYRA